MLTLMPPNMPFMRLDISQDEKNTIAKQQGESSGILDAVQYQLSQLEIKMMKYMNAKQYRATLSEGTKQLLVAGNVLYYQPPKEGGIKAYKLRNYVVERDGLGTVYNIVALDNFTFAGMPTDLKNQLSSTQVRKPQDKIEVYTHVYLEDDEFLSYQECEGNIINGSQQTYPVDSCPWIAARLVKVEGENYGRSYCEEYLGDLEGLEALQKDIMGYAAVAGRIIHLVNPAGMTRVRTVAKAKTGDFVAGRQDDIQTLQLDKNQDFQTANLVRQDLRNDLSFAFLLNSSVQRQAERVTAEEIRVVAGELEQTLGGLYALLAQELQLPIVQCVMVQMERNGSMPELPKGTIEPTIITGVEALGRGQDLNNLNQLLQYLQNIPEAIQYLKLGGLFQQVGTALSIDLSGLIKTEQEVQQEQQYQQQMQMAQNVAPGVAQEAAKQSGQQQQQ